MQTWAEITEDFGKNWPIYASMPVIAALIGYCTKIVAIKMMFRPFTFKGIGPLGWQGIIPKRAGQMVDILCDTLTGRLISADEIIGRIDGDRLAETIDRGLRAEVARVVPLVAKEYQPTVWQLLPAPVHDLVVQRAQVQAREAVPDLVAELRENIDEVFDLREMATREFLSDPKILESMFLDVGRREFAFIRNSGLFFGFAIGIVQALAWALFHNPWVMPLFGLFTGWFTDWAALKLIFNPKEPTRYLGVVTWQGLFLKHRIPVSEEYGNLIADNVLTTENLVNSLFTGAKAERVVDIVAGIIEDAVTEQVPSMNDFLVEDLGLDRIGVGDVTVGSLFGMVSDTVGGALDATIGRGAKSVVTGLDVSQVGPMSRAAAEDLVKVFPSVLAEAHPYLEERMQIKATMAEKMAAMTPLEFESVLRPAFQADERTLILVGAVLGFLVGELQVQLVEHLSH